jgi:hypothetical protein
MAAHDRYRAQVELLLRSLPAIASAPDFALKGGTAINLFLRDMPRLSVDIDLTYLPVSNRDPALTDIRAQLATIAETLRRTVPASDPLFASPGLVVTPAERLLYDEASIEVVGALPATAVTLSASLVDPRGQRWSSEATLFGKSWTPRSWLTVCVNRS